MPKPILRVLQMTLVLAAIPSVVCGLLLVAFAMGADGYAFPGQFYTFLGNPAAGTRITPDRDVLFSSDTPPGSMRDAAFHWFNIRTEARSWMQSLPIIYDSEANVAGSYDPVYNTIRVGQPYLHVFLHEYGHANLDHQSAWQKLQFAAALVRLILDRDPTYAEAREYLNGSLGQAVEAGRHRRSYNPVHEFYADMAQLSGGDLERIPPYLRPFFDDYLSSGSNDWSRLQQGETLDSSEQLPAEGQVVSLR